MNTKISYRHYPLSQSLTINGYEFNEVIISSHYEENHSYLTDKDILEIAQQLNNGTFKPPRYEGIKNEYKWQSFFHEPFLYQNKAYRLVWSWEVGKPQLWILNCFRRKKYDRKKYEWKQK